jgi:hypothetical protein
MDYGVRFTGVLVLLAAVVCGLAFAAFDARAPEVPASIAVMRVPSNSAADGRDGPPAVCGLTPLEGDCTYY